MKRKVNNQKLLNADDEQGEKSGVYSHVLHKSDKFAGDETKHPLAHDK